jgi:hypothetical protein
MNKDDLLISLGDIAAIAGVSPSAVSNWRRRHDDFPASRGSGGAPSFSAAEIERWLLEHEKVSQRIGPAQLLWSMADRLRGTSDMDQVVDFLQAAMVYATASRRTLTADPDPVLPLDLTWPHLQELTGAARWKAIVSAFAVLDEIPELRKPSTALVAADHADIALAIISGVHSLLSDDDETVAPTLFDAVRRATRNRDRAVGEHQTPPWLSELMSRLAAPIGPRVVDLAAGEGGTLLTAATLDREGHHGLSVTGYDVNEQAIARAARWHFIYGIPSRLHSRNALDLDLRIAADTVLADPPFGLMGWGNAEQYVDERWPFVPPGPRDGDLAWLQRCWAALDNDAGTVVVHLPASTAARSGRTQEARDRMLAAGIVRAVIHLPAGTAFATSIPTCLWVLSPNGFRTPLVIDASNFGQRSRAAVEMDSEDITRITDAVARWRDVGVDPPNADAPEGGWAFPVEHSDRPLTPQAQRARPGRSVTAIRKDLDATGSSDGTPEWPVLRVGEPPRVHLHELVTILRNPPHPRAGKSRDDELGALGWRDLADVREVRIQQARTADLPGDRLAAGDIVLPTVYRDLRPLEATERLAGAVFGHNLIVLRPHAGSPRDEWVRLWCTTPRFASALEMHGSTLGPTSRIDTSALAKLEIPLPDDDFIRQVTDRHRRTLEAAEQAEKLAKRLRRRADLLAELAQTLAEDPDDTAAEPPKARAKPVRRPLQNRPGRMRG